MKLYLYTKKNPSFARVLLCSQCQIQVDWLRLTAHSRYQFLVCILTFITDNNSVSFINTKKCLFFSRNWWILLSVGDFFLLFFLKKWYGNFEKKTNIFAICRICHFQYWFFICVLTEKWWKIIHNPERKKTHT